MIAKISKKKIVSSKFKNTKNSKKSKNSKILFCQHNIGPVPCVFNNIIYDSSGYKNIVKQKRYFPPNDIIRNFQNYIKKNKLSKYDIFTLQEIQLGKDNINKKLDNNYYINYKSTGHLNFCFVEKGKEIREVKKNVDKVFHGSATIINLKRFKILGNHRTIINGIRNRMSDIIIIEEKEGKDKYGILSIHGLIPKNFTDNKLKIFENFYNGITLNLGSIKNKYKEIQFIIAGDFNTNILNPVIDEESETNLVHYKKKNIKLFKKLLKKFHNDLGKMNIKILSTKKYTNYNIETGYRAELDFILISKDIKIKKMDRNKIKYYKGKMKKIDEYNELKDDFDHNMISLEII